MLNNIFGNPPEASPVVEATPVVAEKVSIVERIKGMLSRAGDAIAKMQTHQKELVPMVKAATDDGEYLAQQIPLSLQDIPVRIVLQLYHDLNNRPVTEAVKTDSFASLKALLKPSRIRDLIRIGTTHLSTQKGGVAHAQQVLDLKLLEGAQKGVNKALQARVLTDADKQNFLTESIDALQENLHSGSVTPEQVIEEASKLAADPVLGADAQQGRIGRKLASVATQAQRKILDTEKNVVMEAIDGNYQAQNEKMEQIQALFARLSALQDNNDSNVELSAAVHQEIQDITNQIIELVKELDEGSEISAAHIENPASRNINKQQRQELRTLLTHDLDRAELLLKTKAQEINGELVARLQEIQNRRSTMQKLYDGVFNRGSKENAILARSARTQARIDTLNRNIGSYEAALAARVAAASGRTWGQFGRDVLSSINPFKAGPSLEDQLEAAEDALNEFLADENVQTVLAGYERLVITLDETANKKFFLFSSSKKAAIAKIEEELNEHITANLDVFETRQELVRTRDAAELAIAEANQQAEEAEEDDFTMLV